MKGTHAITAALALLFGMITLGCVEKSTELTAAEREQISEFVSNDAPTPQHALDISFENKVTLLGYDLEPERWEPGQPITVTWYWKCERALEEGWLLFTHLADAAGQNRLNHDGDSVVRRLYPPGRWKAGEYVRDVQRIPLPADWSSPQATFYVGVWNGPHRLQITRGPSDGENRARALTVPVNAVEQAPARPALPGLQARRVTDPINVDGVLNEEAWGQAPATPRFVDTMTGGPAEPRATAKLLWDDQNLYVGFDVADDFLKSEMRNRDDHLWEQDCVEVMVDPDGDGRNYFEMQVSPTGVVFDTRYDTRREPQPFGHVDWDSGLRAQVTRRGTPNDSDADEGYTVEIAIPWMAFAAGEPAAERPTSGSTWRLNFFVMDAREDGQRAAGWSPPRVGDFHVLDRFGRVVFFDPASAAAAPPDPGVGAPGDSPPLKMRLPAAMIDRLRQQSQMVVLPGTRLDDRPQPGEPVPTRANPDPGMVATPMVTAMTPAAMVTTMVTTMVTAMDTTGTE